MKYRIFIASLTLLFLTNCNSNSPKNEVENPNTSLNIIDEHNSRNSLDWNGTYEGKLPCADCTGLIYKVILNLDSTFKTISIYEGKSAEPYVEEGSFTWDSTGSIITLKLNDGFNKFKVKEGSIEFLDQDGKSIESPFKESYNLKKTN